MIKRDLGEQLILVKKRIDTHTSRRKHHIEYAKKLSRKIKIDKRQQKRVERKITYIKLLANTTSSFMNIKSFIGISYSRDRNIRIARGFYYKYGVENGIRASDLMWYAKAKRSYTSIDARNWITKLIVSDPEVREMWNAFKGYMLDYKK